MATSSLTLAKLPFGDMNVLKRFLMIAVSTFTSVHSYLPDPVALKMWGTWTIYPARGIGEKFDGDLPWILSIHIRERGSIF